MKCYVCNFEAPSKRWGKLRATDDHGYSAFDGVMPPSTFIITPITVWVCPECGALHTDMDGRIRRVDRNPE